MGRPSHKGYTASGSCGVRMQRTNGLMKSLFEQMGNQEDFYSNEHGLHI